MTDDIKKIREALDAMQGAVVALNDELARFEDPPSGARPLLIRVSAAAHIDALAALDRVEAEIAESRGIPLRSTSFNVTYVCAEPGCPGHRASGGAAVGSCPSRGTAL